MPKATAKFETAKGSKYLQQLCKHFSHKLDVSFTKTSGKIALPTGPAALEANSNFLRITVEADDIETLKRAKNIIDKHLIKFAFRENIQGVNWVD